MHILVNHLVRMPTVAQQTAFDEADREDTADALRRYAEDQTECFCDDAFDWRETETAGGWADEYPENVLFAVDDPESFTKRLVEIRNRQKEDVYKRQHQRRAHPTGSAHPRRLLRKSEGFAHRRPAGKLRPDR